MHSKEMWIKYSVIFQMANRHVYGLSMRRVSISMSSFLLHIDMQCMQSAILFYQFCPSIFCLSNAGTVSEWMDISSSFLTFW